jgi:hypothetical protein
MTMSTPAPPDDTEIDEVIATSEDLTEALFLLADKYGARVTNNNERWQDGEYLRHVGDFIGEIKTQVAKFAPPAETDTVPRAEHEAAIESERWESAYWHLAAIEKRRVWTYKRSSWSGWPQIGSDEYGRRTLVLGVPLLGALVIALFNCRCEDCMATRDDLTRIVETDLAPQGPDTTYG